MAAAFRVAPFIASSPLRLLYVGQLGGKRGVRFLCEGPVKPVAAKPRAVKDFKAPIRVAPWYQSKSVVVLFAGGLFVLGSFGFYWFNQEEWKNPLVAFQNWVNALTDKFQEAADPTVEFLQASLPPQPPTSPDFDVPTVFLTLEGVLLMKEWTRKYGNRYVRRPGAEQLLLGLTKQGFEIVIWTNNSYTAVEEPVMKLLSAVPGQVFLGGVLGREHMYIRNHKGEKRIAQLPRNKSSMLVVDYDTITYENQPDNTLLVPEMKEFDADDKTLLQILALATMYREERQQRRTTDLRSFLRSVRGRGAGGAESAAPEAMLQAFAKLAEERRAEQQERMTTGLGGLIRNVHSANKTLQGGRAIMPTAGPLDAKIAPDSLMDQQRAKMKERMMRQQAAMEAAQAQQRSGGTH